MPNELQVLNAHKGLYDTLANRSDILPKGDASISIFKGTMDQLGLHGRVVKSDGADGDKRQVEAGGLSIGLGEFSSSRKVKAHAFITERMIYANSVHGDPNSELRQI